MGVMAVGKLGMIYRRLYESRVTCYKKLWALYLAAKSSAGSGGPPSTNHDIDFDMSSVLKAQKANALKAEAKGKGKRKADDLDVDEVVDTPAPKRTRNKQRVLLLSSRGITHRMRHLMSDLEVLLPHVKKGEHMFQSCEPKY